MKKRKPFGGKSEIVIILYYWKSFVKTENILRYGFVLQERNTLLTLLIKVIITVKDFGLSSPSQTKRKPIPDRIYYGTDVFSSDLARSNAFSRYFQSIYKDHIGCSDIAEELVPLDSLSETLDLIQVSVKEVTSLLQSINVSKSVGPDSLPNIILKECAEVLAPSLTAFINFGLSHGLRLSQWKYANITPVHKKDKRDDVCNYRPISLLPVISKIQEHVVANELTKHIKKKLYNLRYDFQSGRSCVAQLLLVYQEIGKHLDAGLQTDLILLDFAKAFDSCLSQKVATKSKVV